MPMTVSELQVKVSADTREAETGLASLGSKIGSAGSILATAFGGAAIGGIAALGAGLTASVAAAATFEQSMSAIKAVSGATGAEMEQLSALALQLGADTSFSASEASAGMGELIKAGVSIGDVMGGGAAAALNLAAAGGLSVAESAEIASNAMNIFGVSGSQVGHVADVIAGAANASAIDVHDFGMSLSAAGAVAATVGIGFEDLATATAVMGAAGIKGSDAGTSLKTMLLNLTPSTKSQIAVAKELGIVTADGANKFFDATGKAKSMAEIAEVLKTSTAGLTEQQKLQALQTLFGTDAIRAAAIMAKAGAEGFDTMAESIGKVTAADVAKTRLDNLKGSIEQLKGSLETAGIQLGTLLLPGLRRMVDGLTEWVNKGIDIIKQLPGAWEDVRTIFAEGATSGKLESLLSQLGLSEAMVVKVDEWTARIGDAWRTMTQALSADWSPSDQIDPFVNDVGKATLAVKSLNTEIDRVKTEFSGLSGAFSNLTATFGSGAGAVDLLLADFRLMTLTVGEIVDAFVSAGRAALDFAGVAVSVGRALADLAVGDVPAAREAIRSGDVAMQDLIKTGQDFASRTSARVSEGMQAIASVTGSSMSATAAAVESNMSAATAAVSTGSSGMQSFMEANGAAMVTAAETAGQGVATATETGMAGAVTAVEAQGPVAVAGAEAMGTGMAAGIEAAAPAMAAAADSGAAGAVAAVQGQEGAASSAGQSLGAALGSGLEGGILSYVGRVASAAANLVRSALAAARGPDGADAHSPSKKTEQLGEDMAEGLEIGLTKSHLGDEMIARIRDFIQASRDYIPTAGEIKRVETEIKDIREKGQTDALFRAKEMITVDSEILRLKEAQVRLDRDAIGLRQDLARASREVSDAERGTLADRTAVIEIEGKRKALHLQELDLERQLLTVYKNSDRVDAIKRQIDALHDQDRLMSLEQDRIQTTNAIAATAARVRREGLDDQVRGYDTLTTNIKNQIDVLGAERAVFEANENIIKNATDNEVRYRERLIAVFTAEGKPLADRITAGLALVEQLRKEGKISDELYNSIKNAASAAGAATGATQGLGTAAQIAAPQIDAASRKAAEMAANARAIAEQSNAAARQVSALASSLGKLPSWFKPTGSSGQNAIGFGGNMFGSSSGSQSVSSNQAPTIAPALFGNSTSGGMQTVRVDVAIGGRVAEEIYVTGRELAIRRGRVPA